MSGAEQVVEGVEVLLGGVCVADDQGEVLAVHRLQGVPPGGGRLGVEALQEFAGLFA
ncbi:hypothetical protein [Kitasatospora sp. NPDC008115]|uniref:hypothetical protein n=1 Tax=Kitasatospora sp. NPDC008115 TaxID=3364022 RepID=UPI0036EC1F4B